jgi:purine catabolism regulator
MLRLSRLAGEPTLGLEILVAVGDPEIVWAHVSELSDPAPWLTGGEFLLTTGLGLFRERAATLEFCRRLVTAQVSALGLSTGPSLPHSQFHGAIAGRRPGADSAAVDRAHGLPFAQ